mmetsp:Transcript_6119/g.9425  ORF Transcript_6119/g.9425 Transcript_6119/m.9425 type:complete len:155 (-) Transcript_6119:74-538(-)
MLPTLDPGDAGGDDARRNGEAQEECNGEGIGDIVSVLRRTELLCRGSGEASTNALFIPVMTFKPIPEEVDRSIRENVELKGNETEEDSSSWSISSQPTSSYTWWKTSSVKEELNSLLNVFPITASAVNAIEHYCVQASKLGMPVTSTRSITCDL